MLQSPPRIGKREQEGLMKKVRWQIGEDETKESNVHRKKKTSNQTNDTHGNL